MIIRNAYWIFCTVSLGLVLSEKPKSYEGAQVWRSVLRDLGDAELFKRLVTTRDISLWSLTPTKVEYLVHEENKVTVNRALQSQNLNHSVVIMSVQSRIELSRSRPATWNDESLRVGHRLDFKSYPQLYVIEEFLDYLGDNFPSITHLITIGKSVENRSIRAIKVSNGDPSNTPIVVQSGIHPREWISVSSCLYILRNLVTRYDRQPKYMTDKDWYFIPVLNPDGYEYSHTHDRLWRKNRGRNKNSKCIGVDLNRNFGKLWAKNSLLGNDECEEDYAGTAPFTEPESKALRNFITSLGMKKMPKAFVDFHSFGQFLIYPYGVKYETSRYINALKTTATNMQQAIYRASHLIYTIGTPEELIYEAHGTAMDWCHAEGIPLSFAIETGDTGTFGFLLPPSEIEGTGKELLGAIRALAKTLDPQIALRGRDYETHRWF